MNLQEEFDKQLSEIEKELFRKSETAYYMGYSKFLEQRLQPRHHEPIVMRTGYLCEIGGTKTFVIADNVASAMDCLDRKSNGEDYSMLIHHSIPAILDA